MKKGFNIVSVLLSDAYKQGHLNQYPKGLTYLGSGFTPRSNKHAKTTGGVVVFDIQGTMRWLHDEFENNFFNLKKKTATKLFKEGFEQHFGIEAPTKHIEALHDVGYLPITVRALKEGSIAPIGVPVIHIENSLPEFAWLTNFLESILSANLWQGMTSATIAKEMHERLRTYGETTCDNLDHLMFQNHDFSMRGMAGYTSLLKSGAGALLSSWGTDTIPAVNYLKYHYLATNANEPIGISIPATEHSVESVNIALAMKNFKKGEKYAGYSLEYFEEMEGFKDEEGNIDFRLIAEAATILRLITQVYPTGLVSRVTDTYDFWAVVTKILPFIKDEILARDGKFIIRPDSGEPVHIVSGDGLIVENINNFEIISDATYNKSDGVYYCDYGFSNNYRNIPNIQPCKKVTPENKGLIELLWDIFGGHINEKGYKVLNPKIGAIYGDAITLERADEILDRLESKGFASSNIVFGTGSFTYQHNTRDTYGFAMKATMCMVDGEWIAIYKDPATGDGTKKSLKGFFRVDKVDGVYQVRDQVTRQEFEGGELKIMYQNGSFTNLQSLMDIRQTLSNYSLSKSQEYVVS